MQQSWLWLLTLSDHCHPEPEQKVRGLQVPHDQREGRGNASCGKARTLLLWLRSVFSLVTDDAPQLEIPGISLPWKCELKITRRFPVPD